MGRVGGGDEWDGGGDGCGSGVDGTGPASKFVGTKWHQMRGFQTVKGHCILPAIDVDLEVLVSSGQDSVGPIIWLLQGLAHGVMMNKDMGARGEILADMYVYCGRTGVALMSRIVSLRRATSVVRSGGMSVVLC